MILTNQNVISWNLGRLSGILRVEISEIIVSIPILINYVAELGLSFLA